MYEAKNEFDRMVKKKGIKRGMGRKEIFKRYMEDALRELETENEKMHRINNMDLELPTSTTAS